MSTRYVTLGEHLRMARLDDGLTQRELAIRLRMTHTHLHRLEDGSRFPGDDHLLPLATYLRMSVEDLLKKIANDKMQMTMERIAENPSWELIESLAESARGTFFRAMNRDYFDFPRDTIRIPKTLYELEVFEDDILLGADNKEVYAGLFPSGYNYQGQSNVIVVAKKNVRNPKSEDASAKTKNFQVMHELGHYHLHWLMNRRIRSGKTDKPLFCSSNDHSPIEQQADYYAGAFLIPRSELLGALNKQTEFNMRKQGRDFCNKFFVEPWMLTVRLKRLGIEII